jgi:cobyrinic acid a,c-diamide synthase
MRAAFSRHVAKAGDGHMMQLPRLVIAAPMSGSGKTTITAGLIAALAGRGLRVAPFKCGPDYIDPSYHALAAGRPCANLDAWMIPPEQISGVLARRAAGADLALIEGVMGLFDGYAGDGDTGSTAHIARLTRTPVVIVLDVRAMARTAAALVRGLRDFDPQVDLAGVILNRAGSARHAAMVTQAIEETTGVPVLGAFQRDEAITLPERHLGLVPTAEPGRWHGWLGQVRARIEASIDLDRVVALAYSAAPLEVALHGGDDTAIREDKAEEWPASRPVYASSPQRAFASSHLRPVIAVARDEAFSFLYEDNLELLRAAGAELAFFSPVRDLTLPSGTRAIYLCGGFPELYAAQLSANASMLAALRAAAVVLPIYAECGGLMYLTESVADPQGSNYPMVGALPGRSVMTQRLTLGYRTVQALDDSWLWRAGETLRGHEFHYSTCEGLPDSIARLYALQPDALRPESRVEGARAGDVLASYVHLHFLAMPELARRFVDAARAAEERL